MKYCKKHILFVASVLFCFTGVSSAESSPSQDPRVIRMTLPARLKLEKTITNGGFQYTSLGTSTGHGQKRDDGSEYHIEIETLYVGGKRKEQIRDMEKITLFDEDVWIDKDTKEKLKSSTIDLVYIYSNDGVELSRAPRGMR